MIEVSLAVALPAANRVFPKFTFWFSNRRPGVELRKSIGVFDLKLRSTELSTKEEAGFGLLDTLQNRSEPKNLRGRLIVFSKINHERAICFYLQPFGSSHTMPTQP
jgi:hypothetical protein